MSCQGALDQACCEQEKTCAANSNCVELIACLNACPTPRQDACLNACATNGESTPGFAEFNAIGDCTKSPAYRPPRTASTAGTRS
jgi:hypothetical protein